MKLPDVLYVYVDGDKGQECFVATADISERGDGLVGIYNLSEKVWHRYKSQLRRDGSRKWFDK